MIKVSLILKLRSSFPCVHCLILCSMFTSTSGISMRKIIIDWPVSWSPKGNQCQACWAISGKGKNQKSMALLDTDVQVTILPRLLEGRGCSNPTNGVGHSSQRAREANGPCGWASPLGQYKALVHWFYNWVYTRNLCFRCSYILTNW